MKLDAERIFIRDGHIWTSAGISAGIDLALALIEDDLGPDVGRRTSDDASRSNSSSISAGQAASCSSLLSSNWVEGQGASSN